MGEIVQHVGEKRKALLRGRLVGVLGKKVVQVITPRSGGALHHLQQAEVRIPAKNFRRSTVLLDILTSYAGSAQQKPRQCPCHDGYKLLFARVPKEKISGRDGEKQG